MTTNTLFASNPKYYFQVTCKNDGLFYVSDKYSQAIVKNQAQAIQFMLNSKDRKTIKAVSLQDGYLWKLDEHMLKLVMCNTLTTSGQFALESWIIRQPFQGLEALDSENRLTLLFQTTLSQVQKDAALIDAAKIGNLKFVKGLVEQGSSARAQGNLALLTAVIEGHTEIAEYLFREGGDANEGRILINASRLGQLELVEFLVGQGVDVHAENDEALVNAASNGYLHVVKCLVEEGGANPAAQEGMALFSAIDEGHLKVGGYLLECGAYQGAKDYVFISLGSLLGQIGDHCRHQ